MACSPSWVPPELPHEAGPWTVPMYRPLDDRELFIWTEARSADPARAPVPVLFELDTGAHRSHVPESLIDDLGLSRGGETWYGHTDVSGRSQKWIGVEIPELQLGETTVRAFRAGAVPGRKRVRGELGDEYLRQQPFAVYHARGRVEMNAAPWRPQPGQIDIPIQPSVGVPGDIRIEVKLDGEPVLLQLDTGAGAAIDAETGNRLGLERVLYDQRQESRGSWSSYRTNGHFRASTLEVGGARLEEVTFGAMPGWKRGGLFNRKVVGLLGSSLLYHFDFRIDSRQGLLQLRPRAELLPTLEARLSRWPWLPRCEGVPGCLRVSMRSSPRGHLLLKVEQLKSMASDAIAIFGWVDSKGRLASDRPYLQLRLPRAAPSGAHEVRVLDARIATEAAVAADPEGPRPRLLDIVPRERGRGWKKVEGSPFSYGSKPPPWLNGTPLFDASLEPSLLRSLSDALRTHRSELRACHTPLPEGLDCVGYQIEFTITPAGEPSDLRVQTLGKTPVSIGECIREEVASWRFVSGSGKRPVSYLGTSAEKGVRCSFDPPADQGTPRTTRGALRAHGRGLLACTSGLPEDQPCAAYRVRLTISPEGAPTRTEVDLLGEAPESVRQCISKEVATWRFVAGDRPLELSFSSSFAGGRRACRYDEGSKKDPATSN